MALKTKLISSTGHTITYVDFYEIRIVNIRNKKYMTYTMRGWENKSAYKSGYAPDYSHTYRVELANGDDIIKALYSRVSADISELEDATAVYDVESVTLDKTELSLSAGGTVQLTTTCTPDTAEDLTVSWTSSDIAIATVDDTGLVTAVTTGTATITTSSNDEPEIKAECTITVA
jgi:uncharacterized protein YjdB